MYASGLVSLAVIFLSMSAPFVAAGADRPSFLSNAFVRPAQYEVADFPHIPESGYADPGLYTGRAAVVSSGTATAFYRLVWDSAGVPP